MASKNKLSTLGFTLIELLVVISIIGLISTIVLVSTKGSRDKARLAKVKQFSSQVNHALGAYAVGIWRFEEGEGIDIHDESGYGNHGTFHGNPTPVFPDGVYSGTTALQFDGVDDYVEIADDESLNITDEITIEAWIYPISYENCPSGHNPRIYHSYFGGTSELQIILDEGNKFIWGTAKGSAGVGASVRPSLDTWTHITVTRSGSTYRIYYNGIQQSTVPTIPGDPNPSEQGVVIGADIASGGIGSNGHFHGAIDEVRIYNHALSAAQIRNHYAAGAAKHGIAINDY